MNPNNNGNNNTGPNKPSNNNGNISARAMIEFRRFRSCSPYEGILSHERRHSSIDDMIDAALTLVGRSGGDRKGSNMICYPDRSNSTAATTTSTTTNTNDTHRDKNQTNECFCFMAESPSHPQPSHPPQPSATARASPAPAAAAAPPPPPTLESTASIPNGVLENTTVVGSITRRLTEQTQQKNPNNDEED